MSSFAKNMELCQVLPKIWDYVKFCQKYGIIPNFYQKYGVMSSFVKNIELFLYVNFCQKYRVVS